jgi:5-methylcytosine-specific restriction enzyme B
MKNNDKKYWWLNANPSIWNFTELKIGGFEIFTAFNENGNKRRIFENLLAAQPGQLVIGYTSSPVKAITALCTISRAYHNTI